MFDGKGILVGGDDPKAVLNEIAKQLSLTGLPVISGGSNFNVLEYEIKEYRPGIVMITNVSDTRRVLEFIGEVKKSASPPFFILTTGYTKVCDELMNGVNFSASVLKEPVNMEIVRRIIMNFAGV